MDRTILVVGASVGWGHMQAAINVSDALHSLRADVRVKTINIFDYLSKGLRFVYEDGWRLASCHLESVYANLYRTSASSACSRRIVSRMFGAAAHRLAEDLKHEQVVSYVATQGTAACVGSVFKERYGCSFHVVATDFVLHSLQVFPNVDSYYIPPECQVTTGESASGHVEERARVTGIPIASGFALKKNKVRLRRSLGLCEDLMTVLVSFGGDGLKGSKHVHLFGELLEAGLPLQFVILAGRNLSFEKATRKKYCVAKYRDRVKVYGYQADVSNFYAVADLFMGKAGGLTVSEALASGLPIGVIDRLPGQEEFNMKVLADHGLGCYLPDSISSANWISSVLSHGSTANWKSKVDGFARPCSSIDIANHVLLSAS